MLRPRGKKYKSLPKATEPATGCWGASIQGCPLPKRLCHLHFLLQGWDRGAESRGGGMRDHAH